MLASGLDRFLRSQASERPRGDTNMGRMRRDRWACILSSLGVVATMAFAMPGNALASDIPESYFIEGVPLYQQIDAKGCGAVSLQMVFDYWGPFIDQREIYNAARTGGTTLPDMARGAQFSDLSTAQGDRFLNFVTEGYTNRPVGYAGFYYASSEPWLDELKHIVSLGYPVITLVEWWADYDGGDHYRVIVGYDEERGVILINDGWCREFKIVIDYDGSTAQFASDLGRDDDFKPLEMTEEDFLETWRELDTDPWGVPGLAYGAVFVAPWEVSIDAPETVQAGEEMEISASVTYPCVAPFGDEAFPTFPASSLDISMMLPSGFTVLSAPSLPDGLSAGETVELSWVVRAPVETGLYGGEISAGGLVSGSLDEWHDYPAYDYTDLIGGSSSFVIAVAA